MLTSIPRGQDIVAFLGGFGEGTWVSAVGAATDVVLVSPSEGGDA